ncbi:YoaK family protein [Streptomyces globosus]|uniref:YoaK family protein n=1 Tax=Streptomyces globosus TaxID=68209 RepID=UPI0036269963
MDGAGRPEAAAVPPPLLLALTFVSGLVDAAVFLGLERVFVANMTGNTAFLAFALAGADGLSAASSLLALGGFAGGAAAGGALRRGRPARRVFGPLVSVQALLVAAALAVWAAGGQRAVPVVLLGLAMGVQNAVVHRAAVPDLPTTVVTRALAGLAADPWGRGSLRRLGSVAVLFGGALAGAAATLRWGPGPALAAAVAVLACVAAAGGLAARQPGAAPARR